MLTMNKDQLKKSIGHYVRIRPIAKRLSGATELPRIDDDWIIQRIDDVVELLNIRTNHVATLGFDNIHSYLSEPSRNRDVSIMDSSSCGSNSRSQETMCESNRYRRANGASPRNWNLADNQPLRPSQ